MNVPTNVLMPVLRFRLAFLGAELLYECIKNLPDSLQHAQPQSEENITYGKIKLAPLKELCLIPIFCLYFSPKM